MAEGAELRDRINFSSAVWTIMATDLGDSSSMSKTFKAQLSIVASKAFELALESP